MRKRLIASLALSAAFTCVGTAMLAHAGPATQPSAGPATRPADAAAPLTPEQMLNNMLKPTSSAGKPLTPALDPPAVDRATGKGAVAPHVPTTNVRREGTFIVDAVGRLTHNADGTQSEFTFDADGKNLKDPPIIILPNLKLALMEATVMGANRDSRFRVTGMVTEYRGRNYVLLEKVVVIPDVVQQFGP
ncbi:MAG: hypothetical protein JWO87_3814 [Phycisphaerales bacterium]|jgi:hypothetical protein|nr:hypothetical protein [Phycisphaerales bacterium]MDB5302151.1 hypothetical protein [Phycisphaerales bacterium]MDB5303146.1 hypothetical protein [Phycisphaerales bacterium]